MFFEFLLYFLFFSLTIMEIFEGILMDFFNIKKNLNLARFHEINMISRISLLEQYVMILNSDILHMDMNLLYLGLRSISKHVILS